MNRVYNFLIRVNHRLKGIKGEERHIKTKGGVVWKTFYDHLINIIMGKGDDEKKLFDIYHYIEEQHQYGGIGEVVEHLIIRKLGGICFDCKEGINGSCVIMPKNQTECKWFKTVS